jgi:hypothetical protein
MPDPIPSVPPSVEQNVHQIRAWMTTPLGQTLVASGVADQLAGSMARHCPEVDDDTLGKVLVRLSSHMAGTVAEVPDMPTWMLTNLVAMAGVNLIEKGEVDG